MEKVFISYNRQNIKRVRAIVDEIEAQTGVDCWVDIEAIESNAYFQNVIIKAIDRCEYFVFMLSKESSFAPDEGMSWTQKELMYAESEGKKITIVSIDGTRIQNCKWLMFNFGGLNVIDYAIDYQKEILFKDIRKRFGGNTPTPPPPPPVPDPKPWLNKKLILTISLAIVAVVGIIIGVSYYNSHTSEELFEKGAVEYKLENYSEAVELFRQAAEQGHADAQFYLGDCYYLGEGVAKDYSEAVKWLRKAAEQGHVEAQFYLGDCYYLGEGMAEDPSEAAKWWRKAAEQGHAEAQFELGDCYYNGEGVAKDYSEAVKWYRKAAEQGYENAQSVLGTFYKEGTGVKKDYSQARYWFQKAAEQGHEYAKKSLEEMDSK